MPTDMMAPVAALPFGLPPGSTESSATRRGLRIGFIGFFPIVLVAAVLWFADFVISTRTGASLVIGVLVGMMIVDAVSARTALERVRVWVEPAGPAEVGRPITFGLHVENLRRAVRLVQPGAGSGSSYIIDRDGRNELTLPPAPRGIQRYLYLDLVTRGYFGLTEQRRRYRCWLTTPLSIAPPSIGHVVSWPALQAAVSGEANATVRGDDLFRSVRDYHPGDPPRSVHWPATAHHGHLMVRELDGRGSYRLRIVVNLPFPGIASELALARARWLAEEALRRGWSVELHTIERLYGPPPPPPLRKASGPIPVTPPESGPVRVVAAPVDAMSVRSRLAVASFGYIPEPPHDMLTRVVSTAGDLWLP